MWMLLPALSLAIVHIAGDNVAVVPNMAVILGKDIYATTILAYLFFGSIVTGISAWIGVTTGHEIVIASRTLFGYNGKKITAGLILAVCIPASALTGGYFVGCILYTLLGIPAALSVPVCIGAFSLLASGYGREILKVSNYISLILFPMVGIMAIAHGFGKMPETLDFRNINWGLVLALIGYNAGGLRSALTVEVAACLSKKGIGAVYLAVIAKLLEGLLTLLLAHTVLMAGTHGPLALTEAAGQVFGRGGGYLFNIVLFCTFMNTMAPAMMVNAKQIAVLTGLSFWPSLSLAGILVWGSSFFDFHSLLWGMSATGFVMTAFLFYTAYFLHKYRIKQS